MQSACVPAVCFYSSFNYAVLSGQGCRPESQQSRRDDITDNARTVFSAARRNGKDRYEMSDLRD